MNDFTITSSISTNISTEHIFKNGILFFTSNNSLYNPSLFFSATLPIKSFDVENYIFILTEKELLQVDRFGRVLTTLKMAKRCRMVKCHDNNLFLFKNNCIEIFQVPNSYSNVTYKLLKRLFIDKMVINCSFHQNLMIVSYENNTVCLFNLSEGKEMIIGTYIEIIINIFINDNRIYIVCANSIIVYSYLIDLYQDEFINKKIEEKIVMKSIIYASHDKKSDFIYVAYREDDIDFIKYYGNNINEIIDQKFLSLKSFTVENKTLAIKTNTEILCFNYCTKVWENSIHISDILCYNRSRDLIFIAASKSIKIYKNDKLLKKHGLDIESKITFIHGTKNMICTISSLGTVRLYDTTQFYCFKYFDLPLNVFASEVNEDMSLLFLANTSIFVYDLKKGKQVDEIKGHAGPITKLIYQNGYIYSLGLDNSIRKQYIFDLEKPGQELENVSNKSVIDFTINNHIYVLFDNEICIYNNQFDFFKTFYIKDKRKIIFEKIAIVNECFAVIYGKHKNYRDKLINLVQIYNIAYNIKIQEFECDAIDSLKTYNSQFILQSSSFMNFFDQKLKKFDPVELEIDCNPDKINKYLSEGNLHNALIHALKLQDNVIIERVIHKIPSEQIQEVTKLIPKRFVELLCNQIRKIKDIDVKWIKNLCFYHTSIEKRMQINQKQQNLYKVMQENRYILEYVIKK